MSLEQLILQNLIYNESYARKTFPFLKDEYFQSFTHKVLFELIESYAVKYNAFPTKEALYIDLSNKTGINDTQFEECKEAINEIPEGKNETDQEQWLIDETERFCQERAIANAISQSILIMDDTSGKFSKGMIPKLLEDALAVSFDTHIGHDFLEDTEDRFEFYHRREERIPFDIDLLNKITKGGIPRKTLTVLLASTGVGKSLCMCHMAAANLAAGLNVLYITLEMSEEKIAERIDANLLDMTIDELYDLPKDTYDRKIKRLREKTTGKLVIKEYPTSCAGSGNFRHLLNELKIKKNFTPDIIYIDYLNICNSTRLKNAANFNSYTYIKAIAEELRGLAVENNLPIVTATQTNRGGLNNSDVDLSNTSESFGLPATADLMFAIVMTDELAELNQYLVIQLKNRFGDINIFKRFVIGVDKSRMKLYNVEASAQDDLMDSPVFDKSQYQERVDNDFGPKPKFDRSAFMDFK